MGGSAGAGDEIVSPKNRRACPEKRGAADSRCILVNLETAELQKISRLLIQCRIARGFDQKAKANCTTFVDSHTKTGVGRSARLGQTKFEIGETCHAQSSGQIVELSVRFPRRARASGAKFRLRNPTDCGRARDAEIGRER